MLWKDESIYKNLEPLSRAEGLRDTSIHFVDFFI